ncbi:hypothetical protein ULMS_10400 [Patiriisocius marinistellae]|uniref:Uncharacterized protein n=1 Tax=Patiriisocius marinistellae TaxID=2494560 RepID=A0A5J4FWH4_9FLAO|nr:hypothetical protein [Patiriisocius marinistellae]GEQ85532.1 hypothetical protein ULMS_10400 [Patiriisocius marinistellae]
MKNLFKVIAVAALFIFGAQNAQAQSLSTTQDDRPEVVAKTKTSNLNDALQLTGDQQRAVFRAFTANEVSMRKSVSGKDMNNAEVKVKKTELDKTLNDAMKKTLTAEQYTKYLAMQKQ